MKIDNKFFAALYKSAPTPFLIIDVLKKKFEFSSGLLEKLLGYSTEKLNELAREDFKGLFHPEDYLDFHKLKERHQESQEGEIIKSHIRLISSSGKYRYFETFDCVVERTPEGQPAKITSVVNDITEEVEASSNLKKVVERIEKIRARNSHDLRAPVANILGIIELIDPSCFQNSYHQDLFRYLAITVEKLDQVIHEINDEANEK